MSYLILFAAVDLAANALSMNTLFVTYYLHTTEIQTKLFILKLPNKSYKITLLDVPLGEMLKS